MDFDQLKRREFITLLGSAAACPLAARAQQPRMWRIGVLMGIVNDAEGKARLAAFRNGLQELGWKEGRDTRIEDRWAGGDADRIRAYAAELVESKPDVVLVSSPHALVALKNRTSVI